MFAFWPALEWFDANRWTVATVCAVVLIACAICYAWDQKKKGRDDTDK